MEQPIVSMPNQTQTGRARLEPSKVWAMVFGILFLAAAGFAAWQMVQYGTQTGALSSKISELEASVAELTVTKADLQGKVDMLNGVDPVSGASGVDSVKILAAVDAYTHAPVEAQNSPITYSIGESRDNFARVAVSPADGGGYVLWLKKVGENWTVLFGGQDAPGQDMIDKYGIPSSVLN